MRASEIGGLRLCDVRTGTHRPTIRVPAAVAKGGRARVVQVWKNPSIVPDLAVWKAERTAQGATGRDLFICGQTAAAQGKRIDRRNLRLRFISSCRALGEERCGCITLHHGRHTCATALLAAGWPVPEVRDYLGHASIASTNMYCHLHFDEGRVPVDAFAFDTKADAALAETTEGEIHAMTV